MSDPLQSGVNNALISLAGAAKALAYGPEARGQKSVDGVPATLGKIAESLEKIEKHLSNIAMQMGGSSIKAP